MVSKFLHYCLVYSIHGFALCRASNWVLMTLMNLLVILCRHNKIDVPTYGPISPLICTYIDTVIYFF